VFLVVVALGWRYIVWRFEETIPPLDLSVDAFVAWAFLVIETSTMVSGSVAFLVMSRTRDRRAEADANAGWWAAQPDGRYPDCHLQRGRADSRAHHRRCTCLASSAATRLGARRQTPAVLREMCERLGARYHTRRDNRHAKAGNINACLATLRTLTEPPDFIAVLDATLCRMSTSCRGRWRFPCSGRRVGSDTAHFFNPDPIQHNLASARPIPTNSASTSIMFSRRAMRGASPSAAAPLR
jgi:cellulose synthase (UDP-forming)